MFITKYVFIAAVALIVVMSQGQAASVKHSDHKEANQAVMEAVHDGNLRKLRVLLAHGANLKATDEAGENALVWAADGGQLHISDFLLNHGVSAADKNGNAALFTVIDEGNIGIVKSLLRHGTNINARDADGATPLMVACFYDTGEDGAFGQFPDIVKLLLAHGADIRAKDHHGKTALMYLANRPNARIHEMLLAVGEKN